MWPKGVVEGVSARFAAQAAKMLETQNSQTLTTLNPGPQGVVEGVSARFAAQAAEMLETLRKTESSLRRLRESRAGDAAGDGAGALSATDKVHVQLFLDAQVRLTLKP